MNDRDDDDRDDDDRDDDDIDDYTCSSNCRSIPLQDC